MGRLSGRKFSTVDNDTVRNCREAYGIESGWWFGPKCLAANLCGKYEGNEDGILWPSAYGDYRSFVEAEMTISLI